MAHQKISSLDFGSQVSQLIARRVREQQVIANSILRDVTEEFVREFNRRNHSLGWAESVLEAESGAPQVVFELGVPFSAFATACKRWRSSSAACREFGQGEFGYAEIRARGHSKLLRGFQDRSNDAGHGLLDVWMSHGDKVTSLPAGFEIIASSDSCPIAGMADESRGFYAVQFHPEVTHTIKNKEMFRPLVHDICGCGHDWNMPDYVNEAIEKVGRKSARRSHPRFVRRCRFCRWFAALLHRAIGGSADLCVC